MAIPRRFLFVDCETKDRLNADPIHQEHTLWFGVAMSCRLDTNKHGVSVSDEQTKVFFTREEFWQFLDYESKPKETTWICAHNLGFDATVLGTWEMIADNKYQFIEPRTVNRAKDSFAESSPLLIIKNPPTVIPLVSADGRKYLLIDTLNYWRTSLANLGKSVGLKKLRMPSYAEDINTWIEYCTRDVEIIKRSMVELVSWWYNNKYGKFRYSTPGLAMSAFRTCFYDHEISYHEFPKIRSLERAAYFGGQLEAFYLGDISQTVYQYDCISLYPSVMIGQTYPVKLLDYATEQPFTTKKPPIEPLNAIAEVELYTRQATYPVRHNGEVYYTRGNTITTLAGPELQYAYLHGHIKRWGSWSYYLCKEIFTSYVRHFFDLKNAYDELGNLTAKTFVKLMLNSLYGKFGQAGDKWQINPNRVPANEFGVFYETMPLRPEPQKCLALGNLVLDYVPDTEIDNAFPAISAWVTSYARLRMRQLRELVGKRNYYYQATDSLLVNRLGRDRLVEGGETSESELGKMKKEGEAISATIYNLHWYSIGPKVVQGGKKKDALAKDTYAWTEPHFESLMSVWQRGGGAYIAIDQVDKHRDATYRKGVVRKDGWITPFKYEELE